MFASPRRAALLIIFALALGSERAETADRQAVWHSRRVDRHVQQRGDDRWSARLQR
jgi:hypothetical protein